MVPATYPVTTAANAGFSERWSISGISTSTGYDAEVDIRTDQPHTSTLLHALTIGSGLALSSTGGSLHVDVTLTEAEIDAIYTGLVEAGADYGWYSLKVYPPTGEPQQYMYGKFTVIATPTN